MKTDELIDTLSADPQRRHMIRPLATIALAVFLSCLGAFIVSLVWLGLPTDLAHVATTWDHGFFVRIAFAVSVTCCAFLFVHDLSIPGRRQRMPSLVAMVPFVLLPILALHELSSISWEEWPTHTGHASWLTCLWQITVLAIPAFAILVIAVRRLAPTDLRRSGFYVGLLSGSIGAMGYILHTRDESIAFGAIAYPVAIFTIAIIGALVGPRVLRWS